MGRLGSRFLENSGDPGPTVVLLRNCLPKYAGRTEEKEKKEKKKKKEKRKEKKEKEIDTHV